MELTITWISIINVVRLWLSLSIGHALMVTIPEAEMATHKGRAHKYSYIDITACARVHKVMKYIICFKTWCQIPWHLGDECTEFSSIYSIQWIVHGVWQYNTELSITAYSITSSNNHVAAPRNYQMFDSLLRSLTYHNMSSFYVLKPWQKVQCV